MKRIAILAAAGVAFATSALAQIEQTPQGGAVHCRGGYYVRRLNGDLIIVCPQILTPEQQRKAQEDERRAKENWERLYAPPPCDQPHTGPLCTGTPGTGAFR
jgi:hypothetical protein